jgi:hypothetical protein
MCFVVSECISDCKECDVGGKKCTKCDAEYYAEEAKCVTCTGNCKECSYDAGTMVCSKCEDRYVLNGGKCDSKYFLANVCKSL